MGKTNVSDVFLVRTLMEVQQNRRWILNQPKMVRLPCKLLPLKDLFDVIQNQERLSLLEPKGQFKVKEEFDEEYAWFAFDFYLLDIFTMQRHKSIIFSPTEFIIPVPSKEEQKALMDFQFRGISHPLYGHSEINVLNENLRIESQKEKVLKEIQNIN